MLLPGMEESPPILSALADVFRSHALPSSQPYTDEQALLLKESLNLFEVLCLTAPKDSSQQWVYDHHFETWSLQYPQIETSAACASCNVKPSQ